MAFDSLGTDGLEPSTVPATDRDEPSRRRAAWRGEPNPTQRTAPAERPTAVTTGTTTVAAAGSDGVVLAADRRASLGGRFVTNRTARKVEPVADRVGVAFSGSVGDAQSFVRRLRAELDDYELRHGRPATVEIAATVAAELMRYGPFQVLDLLLAGTGDEPGVYQVDAGGGAMATPYAASGSGMQLAYGALEAAYEPELPVAELRHVVASAVRNATERDTASGDGLTVATITPDGFDLGEFDGVAAGVEATAGGASSSESAPADDANADEEVR